MITQDDLQLYQWVTITKTEIVQIRPANDELAGGHARGHPHGRSAGRRAGPEAVAVRRLLTRCRAG